MSRKISGVEEQVDDVLFNLNQQHTTIDGLLNNDNLDFAAIAEFDKAREEMAKDSPIIVPSWDEVYQNAILSTGEEHKLDELFSDEELGECNNEVKELNRAYSQLHKLDKTDIAISAAGGIVAALIDLLLIGIPNKTIDGIKAGPLGDHVRLYFENKFDSKELEKLPETKVPYDAPYNSGFTTIDVEGLSTYAHRLHALGHDPIIGLIVGVFDILTGKMTTIDAAGKFVSQKMDMHDYQDRKEVQIFDALAKVIMHFKSDVNTAMGLPAPLMGLFQLCQFGNITDENITVAEIVRGMYFEGFDFVHFCSQSISVMVAEITVRILCALKRIDEGNSAKDVIPLSLSREKNPKLATMLFIAHSSATAINAGKVYFAYKTAETTGKNPFVSINYPQWVAFSAYSLSQAKWTLLDKPSRQHKYVMNDLDKQLEETYSLINLNFEEFAGERKIVFE